MDAEAIVFVNEVIFFNFFASKARNSAPDFILNIDQDNTRHEYENLNFKISLLFGAPAHVSGQLEWKYFK